MKRAIAIGIALLAALALAACGSAPTSGSASKQGYYNMTTLATSFKQEWSKGKDVVHLTDVTCFLVAKQTASCMGTTPDNDQWGQKVSISPSGDEWQSGVN